MIITRTPYRISLFGGGTDLKEYFQNNDDAGVLSTTIDKYCYISLRKLPKFFKHNNRIVYSRIELVNEFDQIKHRAIKTILKYMNIPNCIEMHHDGDLPARSGLGTSSSFSVGLINASAKLMEEDYLKDQLAKKAIHVEQNLLGDPVGVQDQIAAAYGGFNNIVIDRYGNFKVIPIPSDEEKLVKLNSEMLLFFTGIQRESNNIEESKIKKIDDTIKNFQEIAKIKKNAIKAFGSSTFKTEDFGNLLHDTWEQKKKLSELVSNKLIDDAYLSAKGNGAWGGKILGAGGGGFMIFLAHRSKHKKIKEDLCKHFMHINFKFDCEGSKIILEKQIKFDN